MTFWQSGVVAAMALALIFSPHPAQGFPLPIPGVQADVQAGHKNLIAAEKLLSLNLARGTGKLELGEESEDAEEQRALEREIDCLARAMYFEARGEPTRGQFVVGRVILNRVESRYYPDTICDVVYQNTNLKNRCQFSFACDGLPNRVADKESWEQIRRRAEYLVRCDERCLASPLQASDIWTSTHYHADYVNPRWAKKLQRTGQIGRHIFYYTSSM